MHNNYRRAINEALKQYIQSPSERSLTQSDLRRILREELSALQ
ncbi:MAG: hypothetical protein PX634_09475 [Microcystis sp. M53600_WE12]|nr:hypothetical protein [Microcystis sp. M53600_WE12]